VLNIECHVDAKPGASIRWSRDGETIDSSDIFEIRNTPDGACRLRISRFTKDLVGCYKCTATNDHGVADTRANYHVEGKETINVQTGSDSVKQVEEVVGKKEYAPRFNPPLEDKTVKSGGKISLSCRVDAIPAATISWYKDGLPLRMDGRMQAEKDEEGNCTLIILDAVDADDGAYRCVASNTHGTTNTACLVSVKSKKKCTNNRSLFICS
jgi:hypothetical protein